MSTDQQQQLNNSNDTTNPPTTKEVKEKEDEGARGRPTGNVNIERGWIRKDPRAASSDSSKVEDKNRGSKGKDSKDLSHVPCKFFKQGACQSGAACPFSHDLTAPGTTKPVCQWYPKGNCKFGHKCALAHILPGQPMSFDRKNKRAAQAALRESQDPNYQSPSSPTLSHRSPPQPLSGIGKSLREAQTNSGSNGAGKADQQIGSHRSDAAGVGGVGSSSVFGTPPTTTSSSLVSPRPAPAQIPRPTSAASQSGSALEGVRGRPSSNSPRLDRQHSPRGESFSRLGQQSSPLHSAPYAAPPSGLSQSLSGYSNGRSSVAAQVMLSEQNRRLSNNTNNNPVRENGILSPSPSRLTHQLQQPSSLRGRASPSDFISSSAPYPMMQAPMPNNGSGSPGIFGTSPFSGSRSLFMPSSYDSNDERGQFLGSPPTGGRGGMEESRNRGWDGRYGGGARADEQAIDDEDYEDVEYQEGFLPSSLNDLLTPEEQRRRAIKMSGAFNPFLNNAASNNLNSRSVPAEMMLAGGRPVMMAGKNAWTTTTTTTTTTMTNPSPIVGSSLLSVGRSLLGGDEALTSPRLGNDYGAPSSPSQTSASTLHARILARNNAAGLYSSSYDPGSGIASGLTSNFLQSRTSPVPSGPGSLPGGLAAGLSQLHLTPAHHSGETPSSITFGFFGAGSPSGSSPQPLPHPSLHQPPQSQDGGLQSSSFKGSSAWSGTPASWSSTNSLLSNHNVLTPPRPIGEKGPVSPSALPRRLAVPSNANPVYLPPNSPLQHSVKPAEVYDEDEIQFNMD